jgi:hypothetical protein
VIAADNRRVWTGKSIYILWAELVLQSLIQLKVDQVDMVDDAETRAAIDAETAAVDHAKYRDRESGDGYSERQTIMVRRPDGALLKFRVRVEVSLDYLADRMA